MLKIFSMLDRVFAQPAAAGEGTDAEWVGDPLRHPDIARMDIRQLGDLPFPGPFPDAIARLSSRLADPVCCGRI